MMQLRRTATTLTLLAAVTAGLVGCGGDDDQQAQPTPSPSPASSEPNPTDQTGGSPDGWENEFTDEQLNAYNAALRRWEQYTKLTRDIYAEGKDTAEARDVFREFSLRWQGDAAILANSAERGIQVPQPETALSTKAIKITLGKSGTGTVIINQCTDYSDVKVTRNGEPYEVVQPDELVTPLVVEMSKPRGHDWMVATTTLRGEKSCSA